MPDPTQGLLARARQMARDGDAAQVARVLRMAGHGELADSIATEFNVTSEGAPVMSVQLPDVTSQMNLRRPVVGPVTAGDVGRSVAYGATLNAADRIAGAMSAYNPDLATSMRENVTSQDVARRYAVTKDAVKEAQEKFRREHPGVALGSEFLGAALPAFLTLGGTEAATAPTMGQQALRGAKFGFGAGAFAGAMGADDLASKEAVLRGLLGGTAGAAAGVAVPVGTGLLASAAQNAGRRLAPGIAGAAEAERQLAGRVGPNAATRAAELEAAAPGRGVVADLTPRTQTALDFAAERSPDFAATARGHLAERAALAGEDVRGAITRVAGGPVDKFGAIKAAEKQVADIGKRVYRPFKRDLDLPLEATTDELTALAAGGDTEAELALFLRRPIVSRAFRNADAMDEMAGLNAKPSLTAIQRVRGRLSDAAEAAKRKGNRSDARDYSIAADELTDLMEMVEPGIKEANAIYAAAKSAAESIEEGAASMGPQADPRIAQRAIDQLRREASDAAGVPEVEALYNQAIDNYRLGMRDDILRRLDVAIKDDRDLVSWMERMQADARWEMAFPSVAAREEVEGLIRTLDTFQRTNARVGIAPSEERRALTASLLGGADPAGAAFTGVRLGGASAMGARLAAGGWKQAEARYLDQVAGLLGEDMVTPLSKAGPLLKRAAEQRAAMERLAARRQLSSYAFPWATGQSVGSLLGLVREKR